MQDKFSNQGFILVTGLIFLVVITLIAVSTLGSSTLQEKMASNLREKSRALEGADAALRDGEARLARFNEYRPPGVDYSYDPTPEDVDNEDAQDWRLWSLNGPLAAADSSLGFLDPTAWGLATDGSALANDNDDPRPIAYSQTLDASLTGTQQIYIEETDKFEFNDLNPDTAARGYGSFIYQVTGRAQGGKASAVAITQSQYMKRY